jgi:hypothetical protein
VLELEDRMDSKSIVPKGRVGSTPTRGTRTNMDPLKNFKEVRRAVKEKTLTLILAGFGLVAALAWNDAVQTLFNTLFPNSNGLIGKFIYALIVTSIVVVISLQLKKVSEKRE